MVNIFAVNYDNAFEVTGATFVGSAGSRVWTFAGAGEGIFFAFDEATGVLEVVPPPVPAGIRLIVK